MIPFRVVFQPGASLSDQTVYAATRAILSGQLRPGDAFPSVRMLSRELKINPNTAHKVIATLIGDGLLEPQPGIGTVVAQRPEASDAARSTVLERGVEELVVEAKRVGLELHTLQDAVARHWKRLSTGLNGRERPQVKEKTR